MIPKKQNGRRVNSRFKMSFKLTLNSFLLKMLISSVAEITSFVDSKTITLLNLGEWSLNMSLISKNKC